MTSASQQDAFWRAGWSGIDAAAAPIAALAITAGLVRSLGSDDYGLLVISLAAAGISMAIVPAIATTATRFVSTTAARGDSSGWAVARLISASLIAIAAVDLLLLVLATLFGTRLSQLVFGEVISRHRNDTAELLWMGVLAVCIQQVDSVLAGGIRGLERFKEQALLEVGVRSLLTCVSLATAALTHNVETVLLSQCGVCAIAAVLRGCALRAFVPGGRIFLRPARSDLLAVGRFGGWMWVNSLASVAYGAADRVVIGHVLGSAAAGQYNVYLQIAQLAHYVPNSLFAFSLPVFGRLGVDPDRTRLELTRSYRRYFAAIVTTSLGITVALVLQRGPLVRIFLPDAPRAGMEASFVLLVAAFLVHAFSITPTYLLLALGRSKLVSVLNAGLMLATVGLMSFLVPVCGLEGAAISRLAHAVGNLGLVERAHVGLKRLCE